MILIGEFIELYLMTYWNDFFQLCLHPDSNYKESIIRRSVCAIRLVSPFCCLNSSVIINFLCYFISSGIGIDFDSKP
jgi:hypothetical protein